MSLLRPRIIPLFSALALTVVMGSSSALAQSDEDIEEAGRLYEQGIEAFEDNNFAQAIEFFEQAYGYDPHPMFLYNISVAYSRQGKHTEAHAIAGRIYDDEFLPADTLTRNAARYHGIDAMLQAETLAESILSITPIAEPEKPGLMESTGLTWMGWAGAGSAATGLTFIVIAGAISNSLNSEIEAYDDARLAANTQRMSELRSDIESSQSTGRFFLYAGTGMALAGTGLLVYDLVLRDKGEDRIATVRFSGFVTPQSAALGLRLSF